jgi:hypothetical protein
VTWHLYLVPIVEVATKRRPEFINTLGVSWRMVDFGFQDVGLVAADVSDPQDTTLQGEVGVTKIPDNLDSTVTAGALTTVQNALENRNIPGSWIIVGTTYRELVRIVIGIFSIIQRYAFIANSINKLMTGAVSLNTQFQDLPLQVRQDLQTTALEMGLSISGFTGTSTLRQILKGVGDQLINRGYQMGGIAI